ncbi:MAG: class I adenylate-forming enzyme family protein [Phycisphaeraceae bacterium]
MPPTTPSTTTTPSALAPILDHARQHPDRPALIHGEQALTYGQLAERFERIAETLRNAGLIPDGASAPRVGLLCEDGFEYVLLSLGILRTGACLVPIAGELSAPERRKLVEATALHSIVLGPGAQWDDAPGQRIALDLADAAPPHIDAAAMINVHETHASPPDFDEAQLAAFGPAFIRFSSGTTGRSKGVIISHRRLLERIDAANKALQIGPGDRVIWILPMAHHFAVSMMLYLIKGAATNIVGSHLSKDIIEAARAHGGTVLYGSPFHHGMLAADNSGLDWPDLRLAVSTAMALKADTAQKFAERFGAPLCQALGIIEAGLPIINLAAPRDKPESIGRPTPDFEIDLRDEEGNTVPPGEVGELRLRGPGMFDGYLLPWQPSESALVDGWLRTGDLARRDEDGDVFLMGRTHSVINVAGLKCFPEEVEAVLNEHPDVRESRVYGRTHPRMGAVPAAEVVARDSENPPSPAILSAYCREMLAAYKRPLQFTFVESLPRTASGKLKRSAT